jgi:ribulose 1,5-bisphosphate synthetase/thiazole synthase
VFTVFFATALHAASAAPNYDVVYGGTSGGLTAALQAARMGRTAVLIEPTQHLGGLTTGGLGADSAPRRGGEGMAECRCAR